MEYAAKIISTIIILINSTCVNCMQKIIAVNDNLKNNYIYKGSNPSNYLLFNNELWRIISINDNGIKIMLNHSIGNMPFDYNNSNKWQISSLKQYLNTVYIDKIAFKYKSLISDNVFLISFDDYLKANSNEKDCMGTDLYFKNDELCRQTNYIDKIASGQPLWTISSDDNEHIVYYVGTTYFGDSQAKYALAVYPSLYLKKNIKLHGQGTINQPYQIVF